MASIDYSAMSYQELRRYFLSHRRERSRAVITTVNDPDFDRKIHAAVERQIREYQEQKSD